MSREPITVDVAGLLFGSLWSEPVRIDTWHPGDEDARDAIEVTEAFTYTDPDGRDWTLIAQDDAVRWIAVVTDTGTDFYAPDDFENYWTAHTDEETGSLLDDAMDESEFDALFDVEPSRYGAEGPMMNFWYPCEAVSDSGMSDAARRHGVGNTVQGALKIIDVPLCVVEVNGSAGLALTGGGMDLTWQIVAAFVALGQLPPVHFARNLPGMAGCGKTETDKVLIAACLRSLDEAATSLTRDAEQLREQAAYWQNRSS